MKKLVLLINIVFSIIGFMSILPAVGSYLLFSIPEFQGRYFLWIVFVANLVFPFVCLASVYYSMRVLNTENNTRKALMIALSPSIIMLGLLLIRVTM